MDAETNIKSLIPGRRKATGPRHPFVDHPFVVDGAPAMSGFVEIFKKTPFVSGLHSVSRDVVKDIPEIANIPLLTTTVLDQDVPQGLAHQGSAGAGRTVAENSTAVKPHSHQDVLRSADDLVAGYGAVVGPAGIQAVGAEISNGNLTGAGRVARTSERAGCATNHVSGTQATFAEKSGFAIAGALGRVGRAVENHCYADV